MNRPYYALAALVVILGGSAVAVGSARCQSATASIDSSRALCASGPRDLVVAASLFVQFDTSWEASRRASFAGAQGSEDTSLSGYDDSCGYDPYRGERFDAQTVDHDEMESLVQEYETWPSDERIESGFQQFEGCEKQPVCGGDELQCPYFAARAADQESVDNCVSSPCEEVMDFTDGDCQRAHEQWLAEHEKEVRTAPDQCLDESAFFAEPAGDAWKTAPVATPDWISDYLSACKPSLEEQYAQAELQAAQDAESALAEYGPTLPEAPSPEAADYKEEYESLYNLDAYLVPEREVMEDEEIENNEAAADNGPVVWSLGRIFGKVGEMFGDLLPAIEEQADDLHDTMDDVLQQWNDLSAQLAMPRDDAAVLGPYSEAFGEDYGAPLISSDEQKVETVPALPVETAQSREMLTSLASSLRAAGKLLLSMADGLEAEAERVLSAQYDDNWSR